jgi:dihydroorotase/N-acyl-D-amino-acid deacylase
VAGWDVLLVGGRVVDGSGAPWFHADVAVAGGRIARLAAPGTLDPARAREILDVTGLVVAPGFLDLNGQGDMGLLADGRALNKIHQGITTEIMGENSTPAPRNERTHATPEAADSAGLRRAREWRSFGAWLREMEAGGVALNVASFVGGSTVRRYAMGMRQGEPTPAEADTMRAVVRRAMRDGALGVATGLIYPPGAWASTDELVMLAREAARSGGVYISHIRSESYDLLAAVDEAIAVGERSGAPVEIYHLKAAGEENWALQKAAIARIEAARARGVDVQAALYPYPAASTGLSACLPPWTAEDGRRAERLADPEIRARIVAEMKARPRGWENWCRLSGPDGALMVGGLGPGNRHLQGRTVGAVADSLGVDWASFVVDLLAEEGNVSMVYFAMDEANVVELLRLPWIKIGSDSGVHDPARATYMTHPRGYGTYPRILGRYVRDQGVLSLEAAVHRMTWAVARRVGLTDRGLVLEGLAADLAVFDPETIAERATFTDPHRLPEGMVHVLVNGVPVVRNGEATGARPGRLLAGPGAR